MEEIIASVAERVGIDAELANKALGIILNLFDGAASDEIKEQLYGLIPGAQELAAAGGEEAGGGLMGMAAGLFGGGGGAMDAMAAFSKLSDAGLDTDQITEIGKGLLEKVGEVGDEELVGNIVSSIPGLDKFV